MPKEAAGRQEEVEEAPVPLVEDCDGAAQEMMVVVAALEMEAETGLNSEVLPSCLSPESQSCSMGRVVLVQ